MKVLTARELTIKFTIGLLILVLVCALCAMVGTGKISLRKVLAGSGARAGENPDYEIFVAVRLPRVLLAATVGAALACAGAALQAILRNPLAEPYILGISSGAGLGAVIAVLAGLSWSFWAGSPVAACAFLGAIGTVWLVWAIGHFAAKSQVTSLLLAGVVVNAFFSAVIMFLLSVLGSEELRSTVFWLMGSITEKALPVVWVSAGLVIAGLIVLFATARQLNVLSFGDDEARALGVEPAGVRMVAFAASAFITAIAVSLTGLIGFVGLITPHAIRLIFGPDHRQLIPLCAVTGAVFLVLADTLAGLLVSPERLPVGVITAITGGPFFLVLLARHARKVRMTGTG